MTAKNFEATPVADERAAFAADYEAHFGYPPIWDDELLNGKGAYINSSQRNAFSMWQHGRAALASAPVAVTAGYALVPIEPTPDMIEAGATERITPHSSAGHGAVAGYKAMLAAAPAASAPVAGEAIAWREVDQNGHPMTCWYGGNPGGNPVPSQASFSIQRAYAAPQAGDAVRKEALYLLREARALLPMFATAEAIGDWSEKVNRFAAGDVIDIPPQADKDGGDCAKGAGDVALPPLGNSPGGGLYHTHKEIKDYARAAVLADRQQRGGDASEQEKMRDVLQWIVDDAASGGVAKLRPQQEKRARAALSAQPAKEPANPKPTAADNAGAAGVSSDPLTGKNNDGGAVYG